MGAMARKPSKRKRPARARRRGFPFERAMVYLIALFVFALPLFIWPASTEYGYSKSIFALVAISLLVILWAAWSLVRGEWQIEFPWVGFAVLGLILVSLLSLIQAANGRLVIQSATLLLFFFLFYLLLVHFVREERDVTLVLYSLLLSATLTSLYGLLQYLGVMRGACGNSGLDELISTMGNRNYLGEFLASLLFPTVILLVRLRSRLLRALAIGLISFNFGMAMLVQQTSVVVALVVTAIAFLVGALLFRPIEPIRRNRSWLLGLLFALAVTFVIEAPSGPLNSVVGLSADGRSWLGRLWVQNSGKVRSWDWWVGWEMFKEHPLFGAGLGNYKLEFVPYKAKFLASPQGAGYDFYIPRAAQAHNEYVQVAAELGSLGILALLSLLVAVPVFLLRRLYKNRDEDCRFDLLLLTSGVVTFLVVALVGFPAHLPAPSLVLVLALGLCSSSIYGEGKKVRISLRGRLLAAVALATFLAGLSVSVVACRDFSADVLLGRGIRELQMGQVRLAQATLEQSARRDFAPTQVYYHLAMVKAKQGQYKEAMADLERCLTRFVAENVYLNVANMAINLGDTAKARATVELLLATHPHPDLELQAKYLQAMISLREGNYDQGERDLEALIEAHPDFERSYVVLGDLYRARGMPVNARKNYERALSLIKEELARAKERLSTAGVSLRADEYAAAREAIDLLTKEKETVEAGLAKLPSP